MPWLAICLLLAGRNWSTWLSVNTKGLEYRRNLASVTKPLFRPSAPNFAVSSVRGRRHGRQPFNKLGSRIPHLSNNQPKFWTLLQLDAVAAGWFLLCLISYSTSRFLQNSLLSSIGSHRQEQILGDQKTCGCTNTVPSRVEILEDSCLWIRILFAPWASLLFF